MTQITQEIYVVDGVKGAHVYVIIDNGVTLVDAGMGGSQKPILKAIKYLGYGPSDIKRIIITHAHIDHILGLKALCDMSKAKVLASEADADTIEGKKPLFFPKMNLPNSLLLVLLRPFIKYAPATVDQRLKDGDTIPVLGGLTVLGLPGHSPGNIGLYCPSKKLLFSSDTLGMKGGDFVKPLNYDVEKEKSLASIKKIGALDYEIMLPGFNDPIMSGAAKKVAAYAEKLDKE